MRIWLLTLLLAPSLALSACQDSVPGGAAAPGDATVLAGSTPEETVQNIYRYNFDRPDLALAYDEEVYDWQNRDEILRTLEVVEVDTLQDRAAVFVRWSVGPKVYRGGHMLRRVGDVWTLTNDRRTYFSEYDEEKWRSDSVAVFDKRLEDWIKESPARFEQRSSDGFDS